MKTCPICNETKSFDSFSKARASSDKHCTYCKACNAAKSKEWYENNKERRKIYDKNREDELADTRYRNKYGFSLSAYKHLFEKQNGVCAICKQTCTSHKNLSVDHDHITGTVRGLLCAHCNKALGLFRDSISNLENAIIYLSLFTEIKK